MSTRKGWLVASARYSIYSFLSCPEADGHPHNNHLITRSLWGKNKNKRRRRRDYMLVEKCVYHLYTPPPWTVLLVITQKEGWWLVGKPGSSTAPGVGNRYIRRRAGLSGVGVVGGVARDGPRLLSGEED